ncbi:LEAF RUST 10 DISEASE-RESISTANCE LOCUS RECEPTOR-LIKE PROTEIN KINASE-like 2.3 isoform X1 [Zingiber officinale]|uniref:LEAF RUST 10 DISEASE-RESISTANCE LOCUS RECEPTOR-LIKE PROTEIN KINASE-like 2.3 isoform X1 n=1 Tax=Zingiber officinale TaxID=94328 RepID=UPI001C4D0475|nr:LEAF RUST 10 DISEASE-RESISTANCE LOCUS RECEPTOR-LIKE PROTEIN KINASE-like 2.3 isoform X1 [Zingiber officinale]
MLGEAVSFPLLLLDCLLLVLFSVPSRSEYSCPNSMPALCGGVNISYPFWKSSDFLQNNNTYCGYQGFNVTCESPYYTPILLLGNDRYRVLDINYRTGVIILADDAFIISTESESCSRVNHSVTWFSNLSLSYTDNDANLTFLYDCTEDGEWTNNSISCLPPGENYVFRSIPESFTQRCNEIFVSPVLRSHLPTDPGQLRIEYAQALKRGFELNWSGDANRDCTDCQSSGGRCGYNKTNYDLVPACFCSDGKIEQFQCIQAFGSTNPGGGLPGPTYQPLGGGRKPNKVLIIGVVVAAGIMVALSSFLSIWLLRFRKQGEKENQAIEAIVLQYESTPKRYTYSEIKRMTNSFSDMLGKGGYGSVFKGSLKDGHLVAVKLLSESKGDGQEFINEVESISRTSHVNIVGLLGFCLEGSKRALVYEFMQNGSLEKFIFSNKSDMKNTQLSWEKLYNIAKGIAQGLEYLHRGCNTRIVHFDIKPHNILLDQDFHPKISDFGLAKMCLRKDSVISTMAMRGTPGYIAPELFSRSFGVISSKSDVYSYGMMILEMVGGRKNFKAMADHSSEIYFPDWVYDNFNKYYDLVTPDASLVSPETDANPKTKEIAKKMMIVGLWCIQIKPENRPSISMVINMLEGSIMDLQMPPKPEFS